MGGSQPANATGAGTQVPNSQFGGLLGSASNAIGRTGDTMQNLFSGKLGTGAQPRPDYNPQKQQQNQIGDALKDAIGKVGQAASSPYDRAAKSQSDSASAWSAMQRGSGDGSGSLGFSSMGAYSVQRLVRKRCHKDGLMHLSPLELLQLVLMGRNLVIQQPHPEVNSIPMLKFANRFNGQ